MTYLSDSLQSFNGFIKGDETQRFRQTLKKYNNKLTLLERDFKKTPLKNPKIKPLIKQILNDLHVSDVEKIDFNASIYDFLLELCKEGHIQAHYFVDLIDKKTQISTLNKIKAGCIGLGFIASIFIFPFFSNFAQLIKSFLSSHIGLPVISAVYTLGMVIYEIYYIFTDGKKTTAQRNSNLVFTILKSLVSLTTAALVLASSITMTTVVATVFIGVLSFLSLAINTCKEFYWVVQEYKKDTPSVEKALKNSQSSDYLKIHCAHARYNSALKTHKNAALINLFAALAVVGVAVASSFIPGGILVTAVVMLSYMAIYFAQYHALKENKKIMREQLQAEICSITIDFENKTELPLTAACLVQADLVSYSGDKYTIQKAKSSRKEKKSSLILSSQATFFYEKPKATNENQKNSPTLKELIIETAGNLPKSTGRVSKF